MSCIDQHHVHGGTTEKINSLRLPWVAHGRQKVEEDPLMNPGKKNKKNKRKIPGNVKFSPVVERSATSLYPYSPNVPKHCHRFPDIFLGPSLYGEPAKELRIE